MTNEELAIKAKEGDGDALLTLWQQNRGFAYVLAKRRYNRLAANGNMYGVDLDDLIQAAFLALVAAVGYYDSRKGYSFISYFRECTRKEFNNLLGIHGNKRDPLNFCISLDAPLDDNPDADTLESQIPDPDDAYESATESIWQEQVKAAVEKAVSKLSPEQQQLIKLRFYDELSFKAISERTGISKDTVRQMVAAAMRSLRKPDITKELEQFIELHTNYYFGVSVESQESPVELIAIRREEMRGRFKNPFMDTEGLFC